MPEPQIFPVALDPGLLDVDALKVIRRLSQHGYQAYLVGGCVRDLLLGEHPKDFDLATDAKPNEIRSLFRNCRVIGRRFRLAHILFAHNKIIEVATFRDREVRPALDPAPEASDQSAPAEAGASNDLLIREDNTFGTAETDALRRDFTINGLFYDVDRQSVIDYVGGYEDIRRRSLVTIGEPKVRFLEDPVRIIRGVKFAARLGLTIDPLVLQAMHECESEITKSSKSRVTEEVFKILGAKGAHQTFVQLHHMGILKHLLPFLVSRGEADTSFWEYLRVLEAVVWHGRRGFEHLPTPPKYLHKPTRAILFAALIAPLMKDDLQSLEKGPSTHVLRQRLHHTIQSGATALHNPRRDTYRVQQAIAMQERLWEGAQEESMGHRRRRRLPSRKVAQRAHFSEALQFMWLYGAVQQDFQFWDNYTSWAAWRDLPPGEGQLPPRERHATRGQPHASPHPAGAPGSGSGRRRRRRRGRRGGRPKNVASSIS